MLKVSRRVKSVAYRLLSAMVSVLAADLIYLYIWRWWYDPNRAIEQVELTVLAALVVAGAVGCLMAWQDFTRAVVEGEIQ